jgi:molybdenum cofactor cytidylyltransferase
LSSIVGILLAAGSASRFGGDKLLAPLADGNPLGLASYRNLRAALDDVRVVIRAGDAGLRALFERNSASIVECADAHLGMSRSLVAGVRAARGADGWVIALGDMPYVKPETMRAIADALRSGAPIVAPTYHGARGNPVGFAALLREELLEVGGDEGARAVLMRHAAEVQVIECDDPGILRDIDTREDLPEE